MKLHFLTLQFDLSPGLGAVIGGGSSLLGDIFNLFGQSKANREQEAYNTAMVNQQRQWAVQDLANQQAYNSPVQQMQRLKEAGLNPNLVYGEGIQAAGTSEQPRSVQAPSFTPGNTLSSFSNLGSQTMGALEQYQSLSKLPNEVSNLGKTGKNIDADTANKVTANIMGEMLNTAKQNSPEIAGFRVVDKNGQFLRYVSPEDYLAKLGVYNMETKQFERDKAEGDSDITTSIANQQRIETDIARQTKGATIEQRIQSARGIALQNAKTEAETKNITAAYNGILNSQMLQRLEIQYRGQNFDNNPIMQQIFHGILLGLVAAIP